MASAKPTDVRIARVQPDRYGETFDWFLGGMKTMVDATTGWMRRGIPESARQSGEDRVASSGHRR